MNNAAPSSYRTILVRKRDDGVVQLSLNRPKQLNALYPDLYTELLDALGDLASDDQVRVVVLTGEGRAFCAGGDIHLDLGTLEQSTTEQALALSRLSQKASRCLWELPKPTIARVNGVAVGGGFDLALACDLIVASDQARFGQFWVLRGLVPDMGGAWYLPRRIGIHRAKELVFTGDLIDAAEAQRIGLCNRVVAANELDAAVDELARKLAKLPTQAIATAKQLMNQLSQESLPAYLQVANYAVDFLSKTDDHREGIASFKEGRQPRYHGQ